MAADIANCHVVSFKSELFLSCSSSQDLSKALSSIKLTQFYKDDLQSQ